MRSPRWASTSAAQASAQAEPAELSRSGGSGIPHVAQIRGQGVVRAGRPPPARGRAVQSCGGGIGSAIAAGGADHAVTGGGAPAAGLRKPAPRGRVGAAPSIWVAARGRGSGVIGLAERTPTAARRVRILPGSRWRFDEDNDRPCRDAAAACLWIRADDHQRCRRRDCERDADGRPRGGHSACGPAVAPAISSTPTEASAGDATGEEKTRVEELAGNWRVVGVRVAPGPVQAVRDDDPALMGAVLSISPERLAWKPHKGGFFTATCPGPQIGPDDSIGCAEGQFGPPDEQRCATHARLVQWRDLDADAKMTPCQTRPSQAFQARTRIKGPAKSLI